MEAKVLKYAKIQLESVAKEDGFTISQVGGRLYIETVSGRCYQLAEEEVVYQAKAYLNSELQSLNQ